MFLSLVRPDRISSPMTRTAAVTIPRSILPAPLAIARSPCSAALARRRLRLKTTRTGRVRGKARKRRRHQVLRRSGRMPPRKIRLALRDSLIFENIVALTQILVAVDLAARVPPGQNIESCSLPFPRQFASALADFVLDVPNDTRNHDCNDQNRLDHGFSTPLPGHNRQRGSLVPKSPS